MASTCVTFQSSPEAERLDADGADRKSTAWYVARSQTSEALREDTLVTRLEQHVKAKKCRCVSVLEESLTIVVRTNENAFKIHATFAGFVMIC